VDAGRNTLPHLCRLAWMRMARMVAGGSCAPRGGRGIHPVFATKPVSFAGNTGACACATLAACCLCCFGTAPWVCDLSVGVFRVPLGFSFPPTPSYPIRSGPEHKPFQVCEKPYKLHVEGGFLVFLGCWRDFRKSASFSRIFRRLSKKSVILDKMAHFLRGFGGQK